MSVLDDESGHDVQFSIMLPHNHLENHDDVQESEAQHCVRECLDEYDCADDLPLAVVAVC
jgi:hypothetical protein